VRNQYGVPGFAELVGFLPSVFRGVLAFALLALLATSASAQNDLSVISIPQPKSACALSNEQVTVHIFNYGTTLPAGTSFNASYVINAGAPVTELITLASPLSSNSAISYVFVTQANLSTPGTYTFNAAVSLAGDVSTSNDAYSGYVVSNDAPSVGGALTAPAGAVLSGSVDLSGQTGDVVEWQQSDDGGNRWRRLVNIATNQSFALLREDTTFRALVKNGNCNAAFSEQVVVQSSDPILYSGFEP
jgi:hypothetical protein